MDASKITELLQKQNTRYINRCQTVDASTLTWQNQIQSSKYIKGVKTCDGAQNCNVPTNDPCSDGNGICSFGGAGRTSAIQTGSPQQFLNVLSGAAGSASQVYSSENIMLQAAGRASCGVPGTSPAPQNSYVVLPACYCVDTNGPTNSPASELSNPSVPGNSSITGNPNNLPVNNQSNPYLPPFDTYYKFKNPSAQCYGPVQDQNQKHFVQVCHVPQSNTNTGVNVVFNPNDNVTTLDPVTKKFVTTAPIVNGKYVMNPPTDDGCIIEPQTETCTNPVNCPQPITNFYPNSAPTPVPPFAFAIQFVWDPITNGNISFVPQFDPSVVDTSYSITELTSDSGVINSNDGNYVAVLTVSKDCCPSETASVPPCFLAGSLVTLFDGNQIPIEDVKVGDKVRGAFGEVNEVLALHRPLLGNNTMTKINEDHHTSSHHPHISVDKKFYAVKPAVAFEGTYGRSHPVLDADGNTVERFLSGLSQDRLLTLAVGILLQTTTGARAVDSLETYSMAPETQLYNLVVSGSHTYCVDGYAVTGWPSEEDFDYNNWVAK